MNATLIAVNTGLGLFACLTTYGVRGDTTSVRSVLSSLFVWLAVAVLPFIIGSYLVSVAYLIAAGEVRSTAAPFVGGLLAWIVVSPPLMLGLWAASVFAFVRATYPGGVSPV